jgi:two-component system chemotaxis response regulator CheB
VSFQLVVVGTSWGGLAALRMILGGLPAAFPLAMAIVQHRGKDSDDALVTLLQERSVLPVREVEDKTPIEPGCVYVAPPDYHTLVEPGYFALSVDAPVAHSRPSIDVLFESAAEAYRERLVGVVLTGANRDGAAGVQRVRQLGGFTVAQDPSTAESRTMPAAAVETGVDRVVSLDAVASLLSTLASLGPRHRQ